MIRSVAVMALALVSSMGIWGCQRSEDFWKGEPEHILSPDERRAEISEKTDRLQAFLKEEDLRGVLLSKVRNVQWITAGLTNTEIAQGGERGAGSLLIMDNGSKYLICDGSEAGRLMDESLGGLGYELAMYNWYESPEPVIRRLTAGGRIGSDTDLPGTVFIGDKLKSFSYRLTEGEIKKYRWLGRQTTEAVEAVCRRLQPGMDEFQMEAITAAELRSRGIKPTVLLMGVDERIYKYRHCLPGGATLEKYGMVNVCAEKWGLIVSLTRFVHFGPLPTELARKLEGTARINAHFEHATVPGRSGREIFEAAKTWYAEVGFPDEWRLHHFGGAIGYDIREYKIGPATDVKVQERQAFAWNPTITGAKIENTIIAYEDNIEVITHIDSWPTIDIEIEGKVYPQPAILIR